MKKYFIVLMILMNINGFAQSSDKNYIQTTVLKAPVLLQEDIFLGIEYLPSVPDTDKTVQISYFDGLGRPIQQIAHKQSNTGKDIVTHIEYDIFGRQVKEFLPYVSSGASLNYLSSSQSDVLNFYGSPSIATTGNPLFEATSNPFSEKQLENSPLNRVFKQAAPGNDWVMGGGKEVKFDYQSNSSSDNVKLFTANATWNSSLGIFDISVTQNGNYSTNQLYKTITKDENWTSGTNNTTEEFKDKQGKVVLKRTYNNSNVHDTYYIFDQYGNLTYVLPPLAEGSITTSTIDNLGYQYKYDNFNRLVAKKLPGKQWEFIVYDKLDRPVATGPALSPYGDGTNGWLITEYDVFGRPIQTGWKNSTVTDATRSSNQTTINSGSNPFVLGTNDILTKNFYDNYSFTGAPSTIPTTLPTSLLPITTNVKGMSTGSWVKVIEDATSTNAEITYILYDTKYRPVHTKRTNYLGGYTEVSTNLDWVGKTIYTLTKHKRTSSDSEIVVKDMFEYSTQDKLVLHKQQIVSSPSLPEQLITKNSYDELGQLISKNVGGEDVTGASGLQKVDYSYNVRGWLKQINDVADINTENDLFAFKINYNDYNSQGANDISATPLYNGSISSTYWITSNDNVLRKYNYSYDNLNRLNEANYLKPNMTYVMDSYREKMEYDKNGNITSLIRNGDSDSSFYVDEIDNLTYTYDPNKKNQLMKVFDSTYYTSGFKDDSDGIVDLDDDYEYDDNGNMIKDDNKGVSSITYNHLNLPVEIIFNNNTNTKIEYIYNAVGQKLVKKVYSQYDDGSGGEEFKSNSRTMSRVVNNLITTEYLSGFQYKDEVLQFFPHSEGYVNCTLIDDILTFQYVFNYLDHLGNVRLSYTLPQNMENPVLQIMEENHYYPFGLKHDNYNSDEQVYYEKNSNVLLGSIAPGTILNLIPKYKYKLTGKEWQDELGLNAYDFGARNYDPALGRWMNVDPLAERYSSFSPYNYVSNNPVIYIDPDGMRIINAYENGMNSAERNMNSALSARDNIDKRKNKKEWKEANNKYRDLKNDYEGLKTKFENMQNFINELYNVDKEWFNNLDNLTDLDGNTVDVVVSQLSSSPSFIPKSFDASNELLGNTDLVPHGYYSGGNFSKTSFGNSKKQKNVIGIQMRSDAPMEKFWHEMGHVFWLASPNAMDSSFSNAYYYYTDYLDSNPHLRNGAGHGENNIQNAPTSYAENRYFEQFKLATTRWKK